MNKKIEVILKLFYYSVICDKNPEIVFSKQAEGNAGFRYVLTIEKNKIIRDKFLINYSSYRGIESVSHGRVQ